MSTGKAYPENPRYLEQGSVKKTHRARIEHRRLKYSDGIQNLIDKAVGKVEPVNIDKTIEYVKFRLEKLKEY